MSKAAPPHNKSVRASCKPEWLSTGIRAFCSIGKGGRGREAGTRCGRSRQSERAEAFPHVSRNKQSKQAHRTFLAALRPDLRRPTPPPPPARLCSLSRKKGIHSPLCVLWYTKNSLTLCLSKAHVTRSSPHPYALLRMSPRINSPPSHTACGSVCGTRGLHCAG